MTFVLAKDKQEAWERIPTYKLAKSLQAAARESGLKEFIKLAGNENRLGISPKAREAIIKAIDEVIYYPDPTGDTVAERLAEIHGVSPEQVLTGNGLFELLTALPQVVLSPGDTAIVPDPSFPLYISASWLTGADVVRVPLKDFTVDLDAIQAAVTPQTRLVWLCNPNNPTGTAFTDEQLRGFLAKLDSGIVVVLDEAYVDYVDDPDFPDSLALLKEYDNLVIARTFSKVHGLAGLRIAFLLASPQFIELVRKVKQAVAPNILAQRAALASLDDPDFSAAVIENNHAGKHAYYEFLEEFGLRYLPTQTNFILFDTGQDSLAITEKLLRRGIIVRAGGDFGLPGWLRVTIGTPEDNKRVLAELRELLTHTPGESEERP
ncbi:MAG: histidinol-phosphate transaminase [Coriobacteriales bacterium]|jgi:histidinol-phosphate aminotransferase|nr:histidinol-phosphate transaminase [Coriobacteriales bacterium]